MALKVWLPLNGDMKNCGLDTASVIPCGGTATYTDGKLGKCLSSNGSTYWQIQPFTLGAKASISFWAKTSDTNAMFYVLSASTYGNLNFWRANNKYYLNKGDSYNNPFQKNGTDVAWHSDAWHHYVTIFDGTRCNLYVDGVYYGTAKTYASPACNGTNVRLCGGFANAHSYDTQGLISDFRIYDTAITEQDVKELYWGKVLEVTPQWRDADRIHDASGFNFPLTPSNITVTGNTALFNGSSSKIEFDGLKITGGTVSVWFSVPAKPTVQRVLYFDPVSRMTVGFLTDGNLLVRTTSGARYLTTGITWGQLTHVVVGYNASYVPQYCLINGVQPGTGSNSNWSYTGSRAAIGARIGGNADWFSGSVNEVKVFSTMLTQAEAKTLYDIGPNPNVWGEIYPNIDLPNWTGMYLEYRDCLWVKVLHHNRPASNIFTTANAKNINTENLFSKLYLFDDTTRFKSTSGKYEFMVREKLESTSTENIGIWSQTSSPTANAIAGYTQIYTSTGSWPRSFGLTHQSANAVFDDSGSSTWWCSCGCNTAYQGGIPSFWGICKTGYLDLYIRVDNTPFFNKPL